MELFLRKLLTAVNYFRKKLIIRWLTGLGIHIYIKEFRQKMTMNAVNYFRKKLYLRCLTRFGKRLWGFTFMFSLWTLTWTGKNRWKGRYPWKLTVRIKHHSLNFWAVPGRFQVNTQRKKLKVFTQCVDIRSDLIKVDNFIAYLSAQVGSWMKIWP